MAKRLTTFAAAAALTAGAALADTFEQADADGDGAVTLTEARAMMPDLTVQAFVNADADGDGGLDPAEFDTLART